MHKVLTLLVCLAVASTYSCQEPEPEVDNPDFSIRLANEGVWDSATGYNKVLEFEIK